MLKLHTIIIGQWQIPCLCTYTTQHKIRPKRKRETYRDINKNDQSVSVYVVLYIRYFGKGSPITPCAVPLYPAPCIHGREDFNIRGDFFLLKTKNTLKTLYSWVNQKPTIKCYQWFNYAMLYPFALCYCLHEYNYIQSVEYFLIALLFYYMQLIHYLYGANQLKSSF